MNTANSNFYAGININLYFYIYFIYIHAHTHIVCWRQGPTTGFVLNAKVLFLNPKERISHILYRKVDGERGWIEAEVGSVDDFIFRLISSLER